MRSTTAAHRSDPAIQPNVGRERLASGTGLAIPALLLFASGTAALVYQVVWIKQLSLVVGVDVYAVTTGVSAFFAGLALGGALFGRWAIAWRGHSCSMRSWSSALPCSASPRRSRWRAPRSPSRRWRRQLVPWPGRCSSRLSPCLRS